MGLGSFFGRVWSGAKGLGRKIGSLARNVGGKILQGAQWVGRHARPIMGAIRKGIKYAGGLPGVVGTVGKLVDDGIGKFEEMVDEYVPEGKVKDLLRGATGRVKELSGTGQRKANELIGKGNEYIGQNVTPVIDKAEDILNRGERFANKYGRN